jgi:hypothetical protein
MPRFDGTGPVGAGPMTGRGLGYCILKKPVEKDGSIMQGYAGFAGRPVISPGLFRPYSYGGAPLWRRSLPLRFFGPHCGRGRRRKQCPSA